MMMMKNKLGRNSYRLTDREHRHRGGIAECRECGRRFRGGYLKCNPTCHDCMRKVDQGETPLGRRQKLYVEYLLLIAERQQHIVDKREGGRDGILVRNDFDALEWQILEYRRIRMMQRLGMLPESYPRTYRMRARFAIKLMNEIQEFNFKMIFRDFKEEKTTWVAGTEQT